MNDTRERGSVPPGDPQGYFVVVPPAIEEDRFEFGKIIDAVLGSWKAALVGGLLGGGLAATYAMITPELFRAQTLIAPVDSNSGLGASLRNQFGGLAALAGVDLGGSSSRKQEFFATLASQGFAREFITSENLMPHLFPEQWDAAAKSWRAGQKPPTLEDGVNVFVREVRAVSEDRKSGLVSISIECRSPKLAADWANRMVELVNEKLRAEATHNSERSIEYLNKELAKTNVVEMRQAIYHVIENQVNTAMLANVQHEFAFRVIDRAVPPEKRFSPKRTLLTVLGGFVGALLGLCLLLAWRAYARETAARRAAA